MGMNSKLREMMIKQTLESTELLIHKPHYRLFVRITS